MGLNCGCPAGASLPSIETPQCKETLGQIQKLVFQRTYHSGVLNTIADPKTKASWSSLLTAEDGTKVVVTPFVENPSNEPGAKRTFGSGNQVLGGIPRTIGAEPTTFTGVFYALPQSVIKAMKQLQCEEVSVMFIDEYGRIAMQADTPDSPTKYSGFPCFGLFVGDKKFGGLESEDENAIEFGLKPNWSDNLVIVTPTDFNGLDLDKVGAE